MGVIAPEHKKKKKAENNSFSLFLFLLLVIGIPFFCIKTCASSSSSPVVRQSSNTSAVSTKSGYTRDSKGLYELTGPVMDTAGVLTSSQTRELNEFLTNLDHNTGVQIVVLTVKSLKGESIEEFSINHAEKWQLGYKGVDNGALLTVAMDEHDVRIETGYGTEGTLTDAKCARIIRNVIIPCFRDGDYGEGIIDGVKNMAGVITSDESLISPSVNKGNDSVIVEEDTDIGEVIFAMIIVFFVIVFVLSGAGGRRRGRRRHGGIFIFPGMMGGNHNHHSSGGFGGGSSFSGGGGHFGGGGASGHW